MTTLTPFFDSSAMLDPSTHWLGSTLVIHLKFCAILTTAYATSFRPKSTKRTMLALDHTMSVDIEQGGKTYCLHNCGDPRETGYISTPMVTRLGQSIAKEATRIRSLLPRFAFRRTIAPGGTHRHPHPRGPSDGEGHRLKDEPSCLLVLTRANFHLDHHQWGGWYLVRQHGSWRAEADKGEDLSS